MKQSRMQRLQIMWTSTINKSATLLMLLFTVEAAKAVNSTYECTVRAPKINHAELSRRTEVERVNQSKDQRSAVLSLRNGNVVRVRNVGCSHISFALSTWIDTLPATAMEKLQLAHRFASIGFERTYAPDTNWQADEFNDIDSKSQDVLLQHRLLDLQVQFLPLLDGTYVLNIVYTPVQ